MDYITDDIALMNVSSNVGAIVSFESHRDNMNAEYREILMPYIQECRMNSYDPKIGHTFIITRNPKRRISIEIVDRTDRIKIVSRKIEDFIKKGTLLIKLNLPTDSQKESITFLLNDETCGIKSTQTIEFFPQYSGFPHKGIVLLDPQIL